MTPTPEHVQAAKKLEYTLDNDWEANTERIARFLAARDAAHAREVAELREELSEVRAYIKRANEKLGIPSDNSFRLVNKIEAVIDNMDKAEVALAELRKRNKTWKWMAKDQRIVRRRNRVRAEEAEVALAEMTRERDDFRVGAKVEADEADRLRAEIAALKAQTNGRNV